MVIILSLKIIVYLLQNSDHLHIISPFNWNCFNSVVFIEMLKPAVYLNEMFTYSLFVLLGYDLLLQSF